jgi:hypothetical protein
MQPNRTKEVNIIIVRCLSVTALTLFLSKTGFTIDFISADIDEAKDSARHAASFKQHVSAIDVVHREVKGVAERVVHMSL